MENFAGNCSDWLESCFNTESQRPTDIDSGDDVTVDNAGDGITDAKKGVYSRLRSASKPHSTPQTLKWLEENYEIAEGVCIPRSTLYVHYLDYCEKNDTQPVNAASFGKIIRQQFPQLTTRRLGTRGQSKYHYYGIGVRESSAYYELSYSAKGVQSSGDGKKDNTKQIIAYSPRSKLGTLLPDFPDINDVKLPNNVAPDKVLTFLMMYRTHCQRILDTVIRANFDEVQSFLLHFWQGMPVHMKSLLECNVLVTLVGVCDSILYRAVANVLMPTVLQPLPESLTQVIRKFSVQLDQWLQQALDSLPHNLQKIKFDLARRFSQVLKRQTSLNHLCQAARTVIHSADITSQMLDDWINVDLNCIIKQTLYTTDNFTDIEHNAILKLTRDFEMLLEDQAPLESYIGWLDNMVDQCVTQKSCQHPVPLKKTARQFLLMWSCFGTRVIRDMTLHSAPSFGSFHLLHLMFDEYVLYLVESLHNQDRSDELLRAVKGEQTLDFLEELAHPWSNINKGSSCFSASTQKSPGDLDRTSVIRGPECNSPHVVSGNMETLPHYVSSPSPDSNFFQAQPLYQEKRNNGISLRGQYHQVSPFPASTHLQRHKNSVGYPSSAFTDQLATASGNDNAMNSYDWYDWSASGSMQTSTISGVTFNKSIHEGLRTTNKYSEGHYSQNSISNEHQTYSPFHCDLDSFKRTEIDTDGIKNKHGEVIQFNQKDSIPNVYQYQVTHLI